MSEMASATGMQGIKDLTIIPSDFMKDLFNNLNASTSAATAAATAALTTNDWGVHNHNIDLSGGASLNIKQVLLWGGVGLLGWYLIRKIRGK